MAADAPKRKTRFKLKLIFLLAVFGAGIYVGVEYSEEIKSFGDMAFEPAEDSPAKPFSVKLERRPTGDNKYEVWLVGVVDGKPAERRVGTSLHTIRKGDKLIEAAREKAQQLSEKLSESLKK